MKIVVIEESVDFEELKEIAQEFYVSMIKGVVDIERGVIAFGGEYHMDANIVLLAHGGKQSDVWGFNIVLDKHENEWIEYTSLINIRPQQGNRTMEVLDIEIREKIKKIVNTKIKK
jgi:hypothetical protein